MTTWPGSDVKENPEPLPEDFDFSIWGPSGDGPMDNDDSDESDEDESDTSSS